MRAGLNGIELNFQFNPSIEAEQEKPVPEAFQERPAKSIPAAKNETSSKARMASGS